MEDENPQYAVVLHEDKQYYPEAEQVFGAGVETLVMDEDAQPLTKPIIEPISDKPFHYFMKEVPETTFNWSYAGGVS